MTYSSVSIHQSDDCERRDFHLWFSFSLSEPRWASVNRGVLICDECCSVHRSLGRHSSQVRHLTHTPWPPTQLQVITPIQGNLLFTFIFVCVMVHIFCCIVSPEMPLRPRCPCWQQLYIRSLRCIDLVQIKKVLWTINNQSAFFIVNKRDTFNRFLFHFTVDGSDIIQQWCKFNLGALSSGPCLCDEWETQGQPSGQTAVSRCCLKMRKNYF